MKPTAYITTQYSVTIMDVRVKEGAEKHVNTKHSWFLYFGEKLNSQEITDSLKVARNVPVVNTIQDQKSETKKYAGKMLP